MALLDSNFFLICVRLISKPAKHSHRFFRNLFATRVPGQICAKMLSRAFVCSHSSSLWLGFNAARVSISAVNWRSSEKAEAERRLDFSEQAVLTDKTSAKVSESVAHKMKASKRRAAHLGI